MFTTDDIVRYYEVADVAYRDAWKLKQCHALHYGFWLPGVKSLTQALIQENIELAGLAKICCDNFVLDAGCGVGGSSVFLAKNSQCRVAGITLSEKQKNEAEILSAKLNVENLTEFFVDDFHNTRFNAETFTHAWFLESLGYSANKIAVFNEMNRVLKPGGKIVIADGFLNTHAEMEDKHLVKQWVNTWAINELNSVGEVEQDLIKSGFRVTLNLDYTKYIFRSSRIMSLYARAANIVRHIYSLAGKKYGNKITIENARGGLLQYKALKRAAWEYRVLVAEKL